MLAKRLSSIDQYLAFAEACEDDMGIMTKALKIAGCTAKPSTIKRQLEGYLLDNYDPFFIRVTFDDICRAKRMEQLENGNRATLF